MQSCPAGRGQAAHVRRRPRLHDRRGISLPPRPWVRNRRTAKMQVAVAGKGRMAPDPVGRNTLQFRIVLAELREDLGVERHLIATNRAVGWVVHESYRTALPDQSERGLDGGDIRPQPYIESIQRAAG